MIRVTGKDICLADGFNYFVYGGEQVIHPESLKELDTREMDVPYGREKGVGWHPLCDAGGSSDRFPQIV